MTDDLEELKQSTQKGKRTEKTASEVKSEEERLEEAALDAFDDLDNGTSSTISVRDETLTALLLTLESNPEVQERVAESFKDELGKDNEGEANRSEIVRLALRYAFREVSPDVVDAVLDAKTERVRQQF